MSERATAHLFVDDLDHPRIGDDDRHHLERVLRVRPGEIVTLSDGRGGFRVCRFAAGTTLEPVAAVERAEPRAPQVAVGFALVKGGRPELIVEKLTECGVDRILPFAAARSVVHWDETKAARNHDRLQRVARAAAMQSRQRWLPVVERLQPFTTLASTPATGAAVVARADLDGHAPTLATPTILIGPEGGWTADERAALPDAVGLGPSVLRAETAAIAAAVLLTGLRNGVIRPL